MWIQGTGFAPTDPITACSVPAGPRQYFRGMVVSAACDAGWRDMRRTATRGARSMLGRALHPWDMAPTWLRIADDPYLFYTAALVPIVVLVALISQRPGELALSVGLGAAAVAMQALLGSPRPKPAHSRPPCMAADPAPATARIRGRRVALHRRPVAAAPRPLHSDRRRGRGRRDGPGHSRREHRRHRAPRARAQEPWIHERRRAARRRRSPASRSSSPSARDASSLRSRRRSPRHAWGSVSSGDGPDRSRPSKRSGGCWPRAGRPPRRSIASST